MIKYLSIISLFLLSACATDTAKTFVPFTPDKEVRSYSMFKEDMGVCRQYALDYLNSRNSVDVSQVADAGARSAASNLSAATISPITIPLSGLGGASAETLSELGLNSEDAKKIISICMHDKGLSSNAYHSYDPHQ